MTSDIKTNINLNYQPKGGTLKHAVQDRDGEICKYRTQKNTRVTMCFMTD